ncbi:MAG: hypothetical protein HQ526_00750 [Actinobacteria bacterium]|nr:hypothetical protein [Actinomycetota bacterium]
MPKTFGESQAELSFQINNQSEETVTLSQLEVRLLGVVYTFEDQIPEPQRPRVRQRIPDLTVKEDSEPVRNHADLNEVFEDPDTPANHLTCEVSDDNNPNLVTATVDESKQLHLAFADGKWGRAAIDISAADPFDLVASTSFVVIVEPKIPDPALIGDQAGYPSSPTTAYLDELDLGTVAFVYDMRPTAVIAACGTGDLLVDRENQGLSPHTVRSFTLRLDCRTALDLRTDSLPQDRLASPHDLRRSLPADPPAPQAVYHLLGVTVRVNSENGRRADMCCDQLFTLVSTCESDDGTSTGPMVMTLARGSAEDQALSVQNIVDWSMKTHEETLAFVRAEVCQAVPEDFDWAAVSPTCYYGDPASVFRSPSVRPSFSERDVWPRSNLVPMLAALSRGHSPFWSLIDSELTRLESADGDDQPALGRKATFLREQLQAKRRPEEPVTSFVRIEEH